MDENTGRVPAEPGCEPTASAAQEGVFAGSHPSRELPPELLAQLTCLPEEAPADFTCAICERIASNRYHWSPRDYERPPICMSCESLTGYAWNGTARHRTKPMGGSHRDRREALRIGALADAISQEAAQLQWRTKHDRA